MGAQTDKAGIPVSGETSKERSLTKYLPKRNEKICTHKSLSVNVRGSFTYSSPETENNPNVSQQVRGQRNGSTSTCGSVTGPCRNELPMHTTEMNLRSAVPSARSQEP